MLDIKFVRENPDIDKGKHPQKISGCKAASGR